MHRVGHAVEGPHELHDLLRRARVAREVDGVAVLAALHLFCALQQQLERPQQRARDGVAQGCGGDDGQAQAGQEQEVQTVVEDVRVGGEEEQPGGDGGQKQHQQAVEAQEGEQAQAPGVAAGEGTALRHGMLLGPRVNADGKSLLCIPKRWRAQGLWREKGQA
ncbi:MAG: hypothetical protein C0405_08355 [Desulfovibrio sp.]|nr:hypothetical protein [Desulfovibrio sp.]